MKIDHNFFENKLYNNTYLYQMDNVNTLSSELQAHLTLLQELTLIVTSRLITDKLHEYYENR